MYQRMFYGMVFGLILLVGLAVLAAHCLAQEGPRGQGYMFASPGATIAGGSSTGTLHFGAGGEGFIRRGFALGGEAGYLAPWKSFGDGIGMLSANGAYHFARKSTASPFITGGYSLGFRDGTRNMVNFGGGVDYWFLQKHGIRLELRDHYWPGGSTNVHFLTARVAWMFR